MSRRWFGWQGTSELPLGLAIASLFLTAGLAAVAPVRGDIPYTSTTVTCAPSTLAVYASTKCTAVVTGAALVQGGIASSVFGGMFVWSSSVSASFTMQPNATGPFPQTCLSSRSGACTVTVIPIAYSASPMTITAVYEYDEDHGSSFGTTHVSLTPAQAPPANVTVVTATTTATVTTTVTTGASISVLDAAGLVVVVGVLMILTFFVGEWRRARHPVPKPVSP